MSSLYTVGSESEPVFWDIHCTVIFLKLVICYLLTKTNDFQYTDIFFSAWIYWEKLSGGGAVEKIGWLLQV